MQLNRLLCDHLSVVQCALEKTTDWKSLQLYIAFRFRTDRARSSPIYTRGNVAVLLRPSFTILHFCRGVRMMESVFWPMTMKMRTPAALPLRARTLGTT